jgi:hypothetical protein
MMPKKIYHSISISYIVLDDAEGKKRQLFATAGETISPLIPHTSIALTTTNSVNYDGIAR